MEEWIEWAPKTKSSTLGMRARIHTNRIHLGKDLGALLDGEYVRISYTPSRDKIRLIPAEKTALDTRKLGSNGKTSGVSISCTDLLRDLNLPIGTIGVGRLHKEDNSVIIDFTGSTSATGAGVL